MMNRRDFEKWLSNVQNIEAHGPTTESGSWLNQQIGGGYTFLDFINFLCSSFITKENPNGARFTVAGSNNDFTISPKNAGERFLTKLTITQHVGSGNLVNFEAKELEVFSGGNVGNLSLSNMVIGNLAIQNSGSFLIKESFIGTLTVSSRSIRDFQVEGGMILNIICPDPTVEGPFMGSVHFDKHVYFPRKSGALLKGPQPYRNMRSHMLKLENHPMAGLFNRLEQLVERENQSWFDRLLSKAYSILSNYGSTSLPLIYFFFLF